MITALYQASHTTSGTTKDPQSLVDRLKPWKYIQYYFFEKFPIKWLVSSLSVCRIKCHYHIINFKARQFSAMFYQSFSNYCPCEYSSLLMSRHSLHNFAGKVFTALSLASYIMQCANFL